MGWTTRVITAAAAALTGAFALCGSAGAATYSNPATITINDAAVDGTPVPATPSPSQIVASGGPASITSFSVTLNSILHDSQKDIDVLLRGPGGQAMTLVSDLGGIFGANPPATLTFTETASAAVAGGDTAPGTPFVTGAYLPSDNDFGQDVASCLPDPVLTPSANTTSFDAFKGTNANGVWDLLVYDDCNLKTGTIQGWSITFPDPPASPTSPPASGNPPVTRRKKCKKKRRAAAARKRCKKRKRS